MKEGILKFPNKTLKENKNVPNNVMGVPTPKNGNEMGLKPIKMKEKENRILTKEQLDEENKLLLEVIKKNEKKIEVLSKNEKIKELFNIKSFVNDNYKEFVGLVEDFKIMKASEMKLKEKLLIYDDL